MVLAIATNISIAGTKAGIDADALAFRLAPAADRSGGGQETLAGVLGIDPRLDGVTVGPDLLLSERQPLAQGDPPVYVQQGPDQGGYFDEIAVDPINLRPGDETIVAARLREELTRRAR